MLTTLLSLAYVIIVIFYF